MAKDCKAVTKLLKAAIPMIQEAYERMPVCRNCKWWDQQLSYYLCRPCHHPHIVQLISDQPCRSDGLEYGYNGDEFSPEEDHGASILFGPDYGCVHFSRMEGDDG